MCNPTFYLNINNSSNKHGAFLYKRAGGGGANEGTSSQTAVIIIIREECDKEVATAGVHGVFIEASTQRVRAPPTQGHRTRQKGETRLARGLMQAQHSSAHSRGADARGGGQDDVLVVLTHLLLAPWRRPVNPHEGSQRRTRQQRVTPRPRQLLHKPH